MPLVSITFSVEPRITASCTETPDEIDGVADDKAGDVGVEVRRIGKPDCAGSVHEGDGLTGGDGGLGSRRFRHR